MKPAWRLPRIFAIRFACRHIIFSLALGLSLFFGWGQAQEIAPDQLIVVFGPKVRDDQKEKVHQGHGHKVVKQLRGINGHVVKIKEKKSIAEAIAEYQRDPRVRFVEPNYIVHAVSVPNDFYFGSLWGFQNSGQNILGVVGTSGADIHAIQAWSITTGSEDIVVGVVDGGVNYTHPDLSLNIWTNSGGINGGPAGSHGYNAIAKNFDPKDETGHGTHVAGIIGALGNNSVGVVGVNWRVTIMPLKFIDATGSGTVADAIDAIDFAIDAKKSGVNVRVLNNSWGGSGNSLALLDEIKLAAANDILFVASAGNSSANNDVFNIYPANYNAPNIIAVAATDNRDLLATFSNYGANTVELGAPGVNILSTYFTASTSSSGYAWSSGTSMAAPQVAGAAALVLANGYRSYSTLRNTILTTVDPVPSLATKTITGGRLNVYNALLAMAVSVTPPSPVLNPGESLVLSNMIVGGTAPFSYVWENSAGPLGETGETITVNAIDTYTCTVTDSSVPPKTSSGSATILKPTPALTWATPADIIYGVPLSADQLNATSDVPGSFVYNRTAGTVLVPGDYTLSVTFTPDDQATYYSVSASVSLNVNKAPLQIVANNRSKLYGAAVPPLTVGYIGFVNGDTSDVIAIPPKLTSMATISSPVGSYPINISGASTAYYDITYVNGTLNVDRAPLTITAVDKSKLYKAAMPALTILYSGFVNGDTYLKLTAPVAIATTATVSSPVGVYPITIGGAIASNYTITFVNGSLTINPLALTITAANKTKTYGAAVPALTATYLGLASGETAANLTTQPALATTATALSPVGVYPITVSGATSGNYTITFVNGVLTNNPALLTISAAAKSKYYGAVMPALTATYSGFVNGDTVASLLTPVVLETSAIQSSAVGVYPITVSGATIANYTVKFVNATLTVSRASLSIRAVAKSKYYGAVVPALTYTVTGFALGETEAVLTSPVILSCVVTVSSPAGIYPITISGGTNSNYTVQYVNATFTVSKLSLSIRAVAKSKYYGAVTPALTYTVTGFAPGETEAVLTSPVTLNCVVTDPSPAGIYPITISGGTNSNYTVQYVNATFTVNRAALSIKAVAKSKYYGAVVPLLTYTVTGLTMGETEAVLTSPVTLNCVVTDTSAAGSYPITISGGTNSNYAVQYVNAAFSVVKTPLAIRAVGKTKLYGAEVPTLTYTVTGFVLGETEAVLTAPVVIGTAGSASSPAGNYPITVSGATAANYTLAFYAANMAVTKAPLSIKADNLTKTFGAPIPPLTYAITGFVNGDVEANLDVPVAISTTALATSPVGSYFITPSGALDANYTISFIKGLLTVTP